MTEQFKQCPTCGQLQTPSAHFCPKCRHKFKSGVTPLPPPIPRESHRSAALAWATVGVLGTLLTLVVLFVLWLVIGLAAAPARPTPEQPVVQMQPEAPPERPPQPIPSQFPTPPRPSPTVTLPGPLPCGDKIRRVDGWFYTGAGGGPVYRCIKGHAYALINGRWEEVPGGA